MAVIRSDTQPNPRWAWLFVVGPVVWSTYFWMEARAAAVGCPVAVWPLVLWATIGLTGLIMLTMSYHAARGPQPGRHAPKAAQAIMRDGFLLGAALLSASVLVGLPTLLSQTC